MKNTFINWSMPAAAVLLLGGTVAMATVLGRTGRVVIPHQVISTANGAETFRMWQKLGVHGRVLWYFDRSLSLNPIPENDVRRFLADPAANATMVNDDNFLYLAVRKNMIRKVIFVVPDGKWESYAAKIRQNPEQYRYRDGFVEYLDGVPVISLKAGSVKRESGEKVLVLLPQASRELFGDPFVDDIISDADLADVVALVQKEKQP